LCFVTGARPTMGQEFRSCALNVVSVVKKVHLA
jgi:hypothetical protein